MANYLVATLPDRIQAESIYTSLEAADLPLAQIHIVGQGYKSLNEMELYDPTLATWQRVQQMLWWLLPFGFFAGFTFNRITQLTIWSVLPPLGNGLLGGVFGFMAAAMGGVTFGGGTQLIATNEAIPFAQRLRSGKYLVVIKGSERLIRQANRVLLSLDARNFKIYEDLE